MKNISKRVILYRAVALFKALIFMSAFVIYLIFFIFTFTNFDLENHILKSAFEVKIQIIAIIVISLMIFSWRVVQIKLENTSYNFIADRLQIRQGKKSTEYFYQEIMNADVTESALYRFFGIADVMLIFKNEYGEIGDSIVILYTIDAEEASQIAESINRKLG